MIYYSLHPQIEAEPVTLAGERYYAVAINGKGHLVHGPAFELLYGAEAEVNTEKVIREVFGPVTAEPKPRKQRGRKAARTPKVAASEPKPTPPAGDREPGVRKLSPLADRVLAILANGPLTHAELADAVYPDLDRKTACSNAYPLTAGMKDKGLIDKKADPKAGGIPKWFKL